MFGVRQARVTWDHPQPALRSHDGATQEPLNTMWRRLAVCRPGGPDAARLPAPPFTASRPVGTCSTITAAPGQPHHRAGRWPGFRRRRNHASAMGLTCGLAVHRHADARTDVLIHGHLVAGGWPDGWGVAMVTTSTPMRTKWRDRSANRKRWLFVAGMMRLRKNHHAAASQPDVGVSPAAMRASAASPRPAKPVHVGKHLVGGRCRVAV